MVRQQSRRLKSTFCRLGVLMPLLAWSRVSFGATAACTAADIIGHESACPNNGTPCEIAGDYDISGSSCTFNFGSRAVTVKGTSLIDVKGNSLTVIAGSFTLKKYGEIRAKGTTSAPAGGTIKIQSSGAVVIEALSDLTVSSSTQAGALSVVSGGTATLAGRLRAEGTASTAKAGDIVVSSSSGITASGTLSATSGSSATVPGEIHLLATDAVALSGVTDVSGADGGWFSVDTRQTFSSTGDISGDALGNGRDGGLIQVVADGGITISGRLLVRGKGGPSQASGDGGAVELLSTAGNVAIQGNVLAEGDGYDGSGVDIQIDTTGQMDIAQGVTVSARTNAGEGAGGNIAISAIGGIFHRGFIDSSGGSDGGYVSLAAESDILISGGVDARGRGAGANGGYIQIDAGADIVDEYSDYGVLTIEDTIDGGGGICGTSGCGSGGQIFLTGCDVTLTAYASLQNRAAVGGQTDLTAYGVLTVASGSVVNATNNVGTTGIDGTNRFAHSTTMAAQISGQAAVAPSASLDAIADAPCAP